MTGGVFVPQLTTQLRVFDFDTVAQSLLDVGALRIRVGRMGHELVFQVDFDLNQSINVSLFGYTFKMLLQVWS